MCANRNAAIPVLRVSMYGMPPMKQVKSVAGMRLPGELAAVLEDRGVTTSEIKPDRKDIGRAHWIMIYSWRGLGLERGVSAVRSLVVTGSASCLHWPWRVPPHLPAMGRLPNDTMDQTYKTGSARLGNKVIIHPVRRLPSTSLPGVLPQAGHLRSCLGPHPPGASPLLHLPNPSSDVEVPFIPTELDDTYSTNIVDYLRLYPLTISANVAGLRDRIVSSKSRFPPRFSKRSEQSTQHPSENLRDSDGPTLLHPNVPAHALSPYSELSGALGVNPSSIPTSQQSTFGPGWLQECVPIADNARLPSERTFTPNDVSVPNTTSIRRPVLVHTRGPSVKTRYVGRPASSGLPFASSSGVSALRATASRNLPYDSVPRHVHPYSIDTAHSHSNSASSTVQDRDKLIPMWVACNGCRRFVENRSPESILPDHLVVHQIVDLAHDEPVICRWCREGRKPIKRESIVRHIREVHMRIEAHHCMSRASTECQQPHESSS
ncbi:hypothetical protein BU15DRAFT_64995 [Melanogaster broomeanus]|nr:hypothetical protein BU15DRAFT_64995 [Melanogaster broomeanus]